MINLGILLGIAKLTSIEIVIIVGAIALVLFTVIFNIVRRKKGKHPCDSKDECKALGRIYGDENSQCEGCPYHDKCSKNLNK